MIERIKKYGRLCDYFAFTHFEVYGSIICTLIFGFVLFRVFGFYDGFLGVQDDVKQIVCEVIGGSFSLIGMSLAGMAIITSLFPPEVLALIEKVDENDTINRVLSQFEFSALNLGIQIVYLTIIYMAIASNQEMVGKAFFTCIVVLVLYHFFFNIFYIIALIGNCIKINQIKNACNKVSSVEKSIIDRANEIRIDYLLAIVLSDRGIDRKQVLGKLDEMIEKSNDANKTEIKNYLRNYYRENEKVNM